MSYAYEESIFSVICYNVVYSTWKIIIKNHTHSNESYLDKVLYVELTFKSWNLYAVPRMDGGCESSVTLLSQTPKVWKSENKLWCRLVCFRLPRQLIDSVYSRWLHPRELCNVIFDCNLMHARKFWMTNLPHKSMSNSAYVTRNG